MRHRGSSHRRYAGCLVAALPLSALDCAGMSIWLKTGTYALAIQWEIAGIYIVPEHGPRHVIDPPAPVWAIGFGIWSSCQKQTRRRRHLGMSQADLWTCY
jgi:hypothetical protein